MLVGFDTPAPRDTAREGCEPLVPALFLRWGLLIPLRALATSLHPHDQLLTFVDDLYVVMPPERAHAFLDTVTGAYGRS